MNSLLLIEQLDRIAWEAQELPVTSDEDYQKRIRKAFELRSQIDLWHSQKLQTLNRVIITLAVNHESHGG